MADKENFDTDEKPVEKEPSGAEASDVSQDTGETETLEGGGSTEETEALEEDSTEETAPDTETSEEKPSEDEETSGEDEKKKASKEDEKSAKKQKKRFGAKTKKDPRDEKIEELTDKVKRQLAEFENFRTRSEKEKSQRYDMGASFVIERMLPVLDNFERGLEAAPEGDAFAEGMHMIYKQMLTTFDEIGVKPIEALGKEFDPELHNAVMQAEATEEYPSGTVAQELQKGYTYHDTVVRHSMVAVSQ